MHTFGYPGPCDPRKDTVDLSKDFFESLVTPYPLVEPHLAGKVCLPDEVGDLVLHGMRLRLLGPGVFPILCDPLFEFLQHSVRAGRSHGRLHMVDQNCGSSPLGDGSLRGIVRIIEVKERQGSEYGIREAGG
ncbi:MAG: hypothetical protein A4E42_01588 [Methanoregulaceae archaeon PtaU1.Bin222]|nr:MAG: hypothetical protein A4E42_01588 [Methanoregulaceae archaeon PtaU1.Bin222]